MDLSQIIRDHLAEFKAELLHDLEGRISQNPTVDPNDFIDNVDFSQLLRISMRTAMRIRAAKLIPYIKVGRKIYYKLTDVATLIENHYRQAYSNFKQYQNSRNK
jgi:hypothetical protein